MVRKQIKNNGRDKKFIGAIIGTVASLAGSIIGGNKQRKADEAAFKAQQDEQYKLEGIQQANAMTSTYANQNYVDQYKRKITLKGGGNIPIKQYKDRVKTIRKFAAGGTIDNPIKITSKQESTVVKKPIVKKVKNANDREFEGRNQGEFSRDQLVKLTGNKNLPYSGGDIANLYNKVWQSDENATTKYQGNDKTITVKDSKYNIRNNQKVNTAVLDDIVKASVKSGVDPYLSLSIAQRESGIGHSFGSRYDRPTKVFSNWEKDLGGLNAEEHDYPLDDKISPKVYNKAKAYADEVTAYPFAGEMKTIKDKTKNGTFVRGYNYGDPDYPNKVNKEKEILMSPENAPIRKYVDSVTNVAKQEMKTQDRIKAAKKFKAGGRKEYADGGSSIGSFGQEAAAASGGVLSGLVSAFSKPKTPKVLKKSAGFSTMPAKTDLAANSYSIDSNGNPITGINDGTMINDSIGVQPQMLNQSTIVGSNPMMKPLYNDRLQTAKMGTRKRMKSK